MCGLTGFYYPTRKDTPASMQADLDAMTASLQHRGPDAGGSWMDQDSGIALGHRRLAVQDLSPQGSQPMLSVSGRLVLVFNGEIYNHRKIRLQLEQTGVSGWCGHSDTETLLAAIEAWGLEQALTACEGMFALALWDRNTRCLSLARDRMGEKPLYYGWHGPALLFGSELKALRAHQHWHGEINRVALAAQMSFISRELANTYSDENVSRARGFLRQRQEEVERFNKRLDEARIIHQELKHWLTQVELEESVAASQLERLRDELFVILPEIGIDDSVPRRRKVISLPRAAE